MTEPEFQPFPKISRLNREFLLTEKLDGTNALVYISDDGEVKAGSRTRWITPEADNYGFAKWVKTNEEELKRLGPGYHYGEFWGHGIQRKYGLKEKRFSLFNVHRWSDPDVRPKCCHVVPELARAKDLKDLNYWVEHWLVRLKNFGSVAVPGFLEPEGIVIFHVPSSSLFKVTLVDDESPKSIIESKLTQAVDHPC